MTTKRRKVRPRRNRHHRPGDIQAGDPVPIQQRRRCRSGSPALEIIQENPGLAEPLLSKLPFVHLVREICIVCCPRYRELRWQSQAIQALQEAAELFMIHVYKDAHSHAAHRKRITVAQKDIQLARRVRKIWETLGR